MWKQSLTTQTNEFGDIYRIYKSHMFILGGKSERTRKRLRQQRIQYSVIRRQHQNTCWNARSARYGTVIVPSMQNYKLVFKRTWQLLTTQQSGRDRQGKACYRKPEIPLPWRISIQRAEQRWQSWESGVFTFVLLSGPGSFPPRDFNVLCHVAQPVDFNSLGLKKWESSWHSG